MVAEKAPEKMDDVRERVDAILHAARQRGDFLGCMTGRMLRYLAARSRSRRVHGDV